MASFQPIPWIQASDDAGAPLAGGKIWTYISGTTTPKATYTDTALITTNTNPIILNARGEAQMVLGSGAYTLKLLRADDTLVKTNDGVTDASAAGLVTSASAIVAGDALIRSDLAASSGSTLIGWLRSAVSAVATTLAAWMSWRAVSVFEFMTPAQIADVQSGAGALDVTAAWGAAQLAGNKILIPSGVHQLNNFRPKTGKQFIGEGYYNSTIKQALPGAYAFNCLSDVTTGQILGFKLLSVGFLGAPAATVAALNIEANGAYTVQSSEFDFYAGGVSQALRMWCPDAANIYNCKIKAVVAGVTGIAVRDAGVYNEYDYFITNCGSTALESWSSSSSYKKVITENKQYYGGYNNIIDNPMVEFWSGAASSFAAIQVDGTGNTLRNIALVNVPNAKANCGLNLNGGNNYSIDGLWITGAYPAAAPQYTALMGTGSSGTFTNVKSTAAYSIGGANAWTILKNWQFLGVQIQGAFQNRVPLNYQWEAPTTGTAVTITDGIAAVLLDPVPGTIATLTINLPPNPDNGQLFRMGAVNGVTAITWVPGAGKTVNATVPTTIASGGNLALMYHAASSRWVSMA